MKSPATGIKRLFYATLFSARGLKALWQGEAAFRQEVALVLLLTPVIIWVNVSPAERALLVISLLVILITEMLNSAIEAVVDRIGDDYHPLSGKAKDIGSAAVLFSLIGAALTWGIILWPHQ
ncbi:diacylglycerol kinase [Pseudohongiella spirulinae]|uniref:Diacylglycerol kinase n=1 Tax=Pseudohongiella spirulinae TaxID=1249552 RepID=A0A0S2KBS6_9GAMM|nr:diacylglycerol kinase [Pseudohongiella spirulinae]ALO45777.1 Diacylglycerol kinase [Pseudohongiella spirulinae]